jgi:hypothetical protein
MVWCTGDAFNYILERVSTDTPKPPVPKKDKYIGIKMDSALAANAAKRAKRFGGLSAVIRALLRLFLSGELDSPLQAMTPKEKKRPPRKKSKPSPDGEKSAG